MSEKYLVDLPNREPEGVRRLLSVPGLSANLFTKLGLYPGFVWCLLEVQMKRLCDMNGDVDILAGNLTWNDPKEFESLVSEEAKANPKADRTHHINDAILKLIARGGLTWPPTVDHLVGIEAKCAFLSDTETIAAETIKSKKDRDDEIENVQKQIEKLLNMGFNKVALFDIISNPPASGENIDAWLNALSIASYSLEAMKPTLDKRLPQYSQVGHFVWSSGSVEGGHEGQRGAGGIREIKPASENPRLKEQDVLERREIVEKKLVALLKGMPIQSNFPFVYVDCRRCSRIHIPPACR